MFLEVVAGGAVLLGLLVVAGMVFQQVGSVRDRRRYPPLGQLVDVGGHRLHAYCTGEGRPTVVLDAALGGSCLSWALVQGEVAKFARVCSYDRAGLGWSDPDRAPRTARQCAQELRALLRGAGLPAPYVLVGHSFGGFVSLLYASTYPEEVAGLVLVDMPHPRKWKDLSPEERFRVTTGARLARRGAWAVRLGIARLIYVLVQKGALGAARSGVLAVSGGLLGSPHSDRILAPVDRLPPELRPMLRAIWIQPKFFDSLASHIEQMPETAGQLEACGPLGNLPLVVLTESNPRPEHHADQEETARRSGRGRHVVATRSGHWIPLEEPQLVVEAIHEVVGAARA